MNQGTITTRMKRNMEKINHALITRRDFEVKLDALKAADPTKRPTVCAELCKMFNLIGRECKPGQEDSYYEELISKEDLKDFKDIEGTILKTMLDNFGDYPKPEEYMLRIVNRLSDANDGWQNDTLRLRILKQFIKYGNCMTYTSDSGTVKLYGGKQYIKKYAAANAKKAVTTPAEFAEHIDDKIFDILETAESQHKKSDGKYGLIKVADDLAKGIFKSGGATKRDLYMFAMVFNMTYVISDETEMPTEKIIAYESDIEKNLFEDYYTNNLMRFIALSDDDKINSVEADPSGQGINYKNFAEMVYIYFISKDCEASEKIKQSNEMITRLKFSHGTPQKSKSLTKYYTQLFTEDILIMPEGEFETFIREHYDCNVEIEGVNKKGEKYTTKVGELQLKATQETAFRLYKKFIDDLEKTLKKKDYGFGLWFCDAAMLKSIAKKENSSVKAIEEIIKYGRDEKKIEINDQKAKQFINLLNNINRFLLTKLEVHGPEDVTRTALVTAYYYWYNINNEDNKLNFIEILEDYTDIQTGLNHYLEIAGYQPISDKNIFDMAVIFSSYAYLLV